MSDIVRFNRQISNFLEALHKIIPENKDIYIFQTQIETMTMLNKKLLIDNFIEHVYPYKEHILNKNEDFFLNRKLHTEDNQIEHAIHLKDLWKNKLTNENKEVVWKYFQVMLVLAERIIDKK